MGHFKDVYASDVPSRAKLVYMYLGDHKDKKHQCYPSIATMARELKLSRSTVKRGLADLEKAGYISREQRYRTNGATSSMLYTIHKL